MKKLIAIAVFALAIYVSLKPPMLYGDGSDPMPLCRQRRCIPPQ